MKISIILLLSLCSVHFLSAQEVLIARNGSSAVKVVNDPFAIPEQVSNSHNGDFEKKAGRFGFIFGGSKQWIDEYAPDSYYGNEYNPIGSIKVYYERFNLFGLAHEDAGVGFDLTFVDSFEGYFQGASPNTPDIFMAKKLYVSGYAYRDFDLGNIITVGLLGGPSIVTNFVTSDLESSDYEGVVTSFGVGIHTGQYILKYLGGADKKKFCLRLGFEQFISVNSGFTGLFGAGLGF